MNLHLLRFFERVARLRGFSAAALDLRISQPAVSRGVRELEAQVGSVLIERGPGGQRLTEAGAILFGHCQTLFAAERAAEEDLLAIAGLARGNLHIGASTTIATYFLPPLISEFQSSHPALHMRLTSANTHDIAGRLLNREFDIAFVEGPVDEPGLVTTLWRHDELVLVAAPGHGLARRVAAGELLAASDLARALHILREPGSGTREVVEQAMVRHRIEPERIMEIGSTEAIKQIVAAGLGIAFVSAEAARDQIALGKLVTLKVEGMKLRRPLSQLAIERAQQSAAAAAFETFATAGSSSATAQRWKMTPSTSKGSRRKSKP